MVFDKDANEWRPRWGYKVGVITYNQSQKAGTDPMDNWITEDK